MLYMLLIYIYIFLYLLFRPLHFIVFFVSPSYNEEQMAVLNIGCPWSRRFMFGFWCRLCFFFIHVSAVVCWILVFVFCCGCSDGEWLEITSFLLHYSKGKKENKEEYKHNGNICICSLLVKIHIILKMCTKLCSIHVCMKICMENLKLFITNILLFQTQTCKHALEVVS